MGQAMMGGALANMLDNPAMVGAAVESGESMIAQLKDAWARDMAQKFDQQYGENVRARKEQIIAKYDQDTRIHQIPFNAEEEAQATSLEGAPVIPREGYRIVDPMTGETSYIEANSPEAVSYFRERTEEYFSSLNQLTSEYLEAASQYPNNPYIQAKANVMMSGMTGRIAAMREAGQMAEERMDQQLKAEQFRELEEARLEKGITKEAQLNIGYAILAEQHGLSSVLEAKERFIDRDARVAARSARTMQELRKEDIDITRAETQLEADVELGFEYGMKKDPSAVIGLDPNDPKDRKDLLKWYYKKVAADEAYDRARRRLREGRAYNKLDVEIPPDLIPNLVLEDRGLENRAVLEVGRIEETERKDKLEKELKRRVRAHPDVDDAIMKRVRAVPALEDIPDYKAAAGEKPEDVAERQRKYREAKMILFEAEAAVPEVSKPAVLKKMQAGLIEEYIRRSPDWREEWIREGSVEEFLGTKWPDMFPQYTPEDVNKPISKDNNMENVEPIDLAQFEEKMAMAVKGAVESRPPFEQVEAAIELSKSGYSRLLPPDPEEYALALDVVQKDLDAFRIMRKVMAQEMVLLSKVLEPEDLEQAREMYNNKINSFIASIEILATAKGKLSSVKEELEKLKAKSAHRKGTPAPLAVSAGKAVKGAAESVRQTLEESPIYQYRGLFPERMERRSGR
jgi:prefoldin subunit 5